MSQDDGKGVLYVGGRYWVRNSLRGGGGSGAAEVSMIVQQAWGCALDGGPKVYLIVLVLWKNGSGFSACTSIDPKLRRRIRGWPSGLQKKKRSAKRSTSHPLMPTSAFVSIRGIRSARFSTAPDL